MDPQQKEEAALQPFSDGEQAPIGKGMELLLYLDESGKQLLKASKIRGMTDEQLVAAHRATLDLMVRLKAKRDGLNKRYRRREISSTKEIMKARRWLAKAGAMVSLIENERSLRKKRFATSFAQAFVDAAQQMLDSETFGALIDRAAAAAAQQ